MGGSSNKSDAASQPQPVIQMPVEYTSPAIMPGQLSLLASQMNKGFGGGVAENQSILSSRFQPSTAYYIQRPNQMRGLLDQLGLVSGQPYGGKKEDD